MCVVAPRDLVEVTGEFVHANIRTCSHAHMRIGVCANMRTCAHAHPIIISMSGLIIGCGRSIDID